MHEFSIAAQILDTAREHAEEEGASYVTRLEIEVGEASHVNPRQLETCMDAAKTDTIAAQATVEIETAAPYAECACGWRGEPAVAENALVYAPDLTCPSCGERIDLAGGDSCRLMSLTVSDEVSDTEESADERESGETA
ncbi:hydrogenase maturation nickel metallochaperone HypA/HybF [Halapricum desulfuricans]|uniref:Hydrogenase maturation factor HypA n=1 Tax=Halapricum desulfuricans TaxID=2841257 RepID=A0A897NK48_9EURY|nr:hydrogenase maturation nickel metallochaperone HypA [Halapricum desulfuricans]QSG08900.1 Zn finger protein HypA/HybF (possibly regulatinghydrogenase expression) [Halapricum desulfuricans]QSG11825.1 Zn finger protein HypA/HybF (possibly regulatinghydrogenase expression) [Halapricum desulfuricans]